jgi:DNA polymerase-3 subunit delta'
VNAANALLKTLEEPSQEAYLLLVCHQAGLLPATIRSRCQQWHFATPPSMTALAWLEKQQINASLPLSALLNLAHGAPLSALALAKEGAWDSRQQFYDALFSLARHQGDVLAYAAKFQKEELAWLLQLSLSYIMDVLKVKSGVMLSSITNTDRENDVKTLVPQTRLSLLADFMAQCGVWQKQLYIGLQLNKTLILEALFYQWMECVK